MSEDTRPPAAKSWRTHCTACGSKKEKKWGPRRLTLSKHCSNASCWLFGIPQLCSVKVVVTFDRFGRRHVSHKEVAVRRRPTFTVPTILQRADGPVADS